MTHESTKTRNHEKDSVSLFRAFVLSWFRAFVVSCVTGAGLCTPLSAADDPLARARSLYNQRQFEAAVSAAEEARLKPANADAADLVAARSYLERFRQTAMTEDLTAARERLRRLDPLRLAPRERSEYIVGLG